MRLQLDQFGKIKNYLHMAQGGLLALTWILTIALLTQDGETDGRVGWYFGLCWLTIPILIYLVMVPMWSRARRFANVYAFAALDSLSIVLWLSAWAAVASYVSAGKGKGDNEDASGCDNFLYGSATRCRLSEAIIAFGVFIMLLFIATAFVSFRAVMTYKRTGMMPAQLGGENKVSDFSAPTQDDFSSNMRNDDFDDHDGNGEQQHYAYQKPEDFDTYAPVQQNDQDEMSHVPQLPMDPIGGGGQQGLGLQYDTGYHGADSNGSYRGTK